MRSTAGARFDGPASAGRGVLLCAALALAAPARAAAPAAFAHDSAAADTTPRSVPTGAAARIYLTWHAPYGQRRATQRLTAACGDTTGKDTLYLCVDPGEGAYQMVGLTASVYFRAATGESLGTNWSFGEGEDIKRLVVQFDPDSVPGAGPLFPATPFARSGYSRTAGSGELKMIVAVSELQPQAVQGGTIYTVARLLVPRPARRYPGCDRGICIEWGFGSIAYDGNHEPQVNRGQRFVNWNSPNGKACAPLESFAAPPPWRPPGTPR